MRRIVLHTILFQELEKFVLIGSRRMMGWLVLDILHDAFRLRCAHAERSVSFLPGEILAGSVCIVDPF